MPEAQNGDKGTRTRERLLEVAGRLFAEKGFENATLREICELAGANVAAVNYHFGDKKSLYLRTIEHAHRQKMSQSSEPEWPPGTPPARKLEAFVQRFLVRLLDDERVPQHRALMMREMASPTEATAHLVREYIRPEFQRLVSILAELLPPDVGQERLHLFAFGVVGQCLQHRVCAPVNGLLVSEEEFRGYRPERLAAHIAAVTLAAVGAGPPAHQVELPR